MIGITRGRIASVQPEKTEHTVLVHCDGLKKLTAAWWRPQVEPSQRRPRSSLIVRVRQCEASGLSLRVGPYGVDAVAMLAAVIDGKASRADIVESLATFHELFSRPDPEI